MYVLSKDVVCSSLLVARQTIVRILLLRDTRYEIPITSNGFSLLELIGVIAIIAILGSVITPNVINHLNAAARDAELETLDGIAHAIEVYLRENHTWPPTLVSLSPNYLSTNTVQLTQNDRGFPRYFFVHPDISAITNATGLSSSEIDDAQFLLISNLKADAVPTITNAAEFDAWWNTDESSTPDLKIHRGQVSDLFSLLTLNATGSRGGYQIDGTTTNWDCQTKPELDHNKYHLTGTTVAFDEISQYAIPEVQFSLAKDLSYRFDPCHATGSRWRTVPSANPECWSLWITTDKDVSGSGDPCLDTWDDAEIVQVGQAYFSLEPGTSAGTFSSPANMENQSLLGLASLHAIHYVTRNITVGSTTTFDLLAGDLLLAHHGGLELVGAVWTGKEDVFVFRPNTAGDYGSGTVSMLLNDFSGHAHAISLVETATVVGDTTLSAGSFLFGTSGGGKNDIQLFTPTEVGSTTSGTTSILIDGASIGMTKEVTGLDLIETSLMIGGITLDSGTILVTLKDDNPGVGTNRIATLEEDIFYLTVTSTEIGSGSSVATATLLLEGADVNLDSKDEAVHGLSLAPTL